MAKELDELSATAQQNKLLQEQCALLREQNDILRGVSSSNDDEREIFVKNIDRDEMRSGFLVTRHRKKLWNVQINLLNEFARICQKHDLPWFAIGGTLLGAARHKGFIPWDFDMDVIMFRPDYNKFQQVAAQEVEAPYFLDVWYDYRLESEGASLNDDEGDYQFITRKQQASYANHWLTQWPSIRLRDSRTTMIEALDRNFINQGIWLDIFPLDSLPPFDDKRQALNFEVGKVLLMATASPALVRDAMNRNLKLFMDYGVLEKFLAKPYRERGKTFDEFMNRKFDVTERMGDIRDYCITTGEKFYQSKDFRDVTYLPFEKIEVPAPIGYDSVLTDFYGDWRKPVMYPPHVADFSADIPFKEYFQKRA